MSLEHPNRLNRLILCLSFSNLVFLPGWLKLFRLRAEALEYMGSTGAQVLLFATLFNIALLSVGFYQIDSMMHRFKKRLVRRISTCAFLFLMATAVDWLAWQLVCFGLREGYPKSLLYFIWILAITVPIVGCITVTIFGNDGIIRAARIFLWLMAPLPFFFLGTFIISVVKAPSRHCVA